MTGFLSTLGSAVASGDAQRVADVLVLEWHARRPGGWHGAEDDATAALPDQLLPDVVARVIAWRTPDTHPHVDDLLVHVLAVRTAVPPAAVSALLEHIAGYAFVPPPLLVEALRRAAENDQPVDGLAVAAARRTLYSVADPDLLALVQRLPAPPLNPGEAWADAALAVTDPAWTTLLSLTAAAPARPSARWARRAAELLQEHDRERLVDVIALAGAPRTVRLRSEDGSPNTAFDPVNVRTLQCLVWVLDAALADRPALAPAAAHALGDLARAALRVVPGQDRRPTGLAVAAVEVLGRMADDAAAAEQLRLLADLDVPAKVRSAVTRAPQADRTATR